MDYLNPKRLFSGKRFDVLSIDVKTEEGALVQKEVVSHPGAVVVLPLLDPETILFIRNERYVVQKTLLELPAGTLEKGEEPLVCAARELIEETGYQAKMIRPLLSFYSTPGFCNEVLHTFVAEDLVFVGQDLDEGEKIVVEPISVHEAMEKARSGQVVDAKTLATLFYYLITRP